MSLANPELRKTPCFSFPELCASSAIISDGLKLMLWKNNTSKFIPGRQTSYSTYDQSIIRNILFPIIASQSLYRELSFPVFEADELTRVYYKLVAYSRGINCYSNQCCSLTTYIHPNCWIFCICVDCIYMVMFTYCVVCSVLTWISANMCKGTATASPFPQKHTLRFTEFMFSLYFTHFRTPPAYSFYSIQLFYNTTLTAITLN